METTTTQDIDNQLLAALRLEDMSLVRKIDALEFINFFADDNRLDTFLAKADFSDSKKTNLFWFAVVEGVKKRITKQFFDSSLAFPFTTNILYTVLKTGNVKAMRLFSRNISKSFTEEYPHFRKDALNKFLKTQPKELSDSVRQNLIDVFSDKSFHCDRCLFFSLPILRHNFDELLKFQKAIPLLNLNEELYLAGEDVHAIINQGKLVCFYLDYKDDFLSRPLVKNNFLGALSEHRIESAQTTTKNACAQIVDLYTVCDVSFLLDVFKMYETNDERFDFFLNVVLARPKNDIFDLLERVDMNEKKLLKTSSKFQNLRNLLERKLLSYSLDESVMDNTKDGINVGKRKM